MCNYAYRAERALAWLLTRVVTDVRFRDRPKALWQKSPRGADGENGGDVTKVTDGAEVADRHGRAAA